MASNVKKTVLEFGTLLIPVSLMSITESQDVQFARRASEEGGAVKRIEVAENTGQPIESKAAIERGVYVGEVFHPIPEEKIAAIEEATKLESFAIEKFIPIEDVPWERVKGGYFLVPQKGQSPRAMRLLLDAMKPVIGPRGKVLRTARVGVFRLMPRTRQSCAIVYAADDGLLVSVLHWAEDFAQVEAAKKTLAGIASDETHLERARELIEAFTTDGSYLDGMVDEARELKRELMAQAAEGKPIPTTLKPKPVATDDLMAKLEESLKSSTKRARATAR